MNDLKSKIKAGSINYGSEKQLNSFETIHDMVIKTSQLNKSDIKKTEGTGYRALDIAYTKKDAEIKKARVAEKQAEISEAIDDELFDRAYEHLKIKFGENGYAKFFFKDDVYEKFLKDIRDLLSNKDNYIEAQRDYINKLKENGEL